MFANRIVMIGGGALLTSVLAGCNVPTVATPFLTPDQETSDGGSDEFGAADGETGGGGGGVEKAPNSCITEPDGSYGYRHHCGGNLKFHLAGAAEGQTFERFYDYGFGPGHVDNDLERLDTYNSPMVANCCGGPYDFEMAAADQKVYFENCKLDAVQQMCAATSQWMLLLAEQYPLAAPKLKAAAETLGTEDVQTECVLALFEAGLLDDQGEPVPDQHYRMITDTLWSIEAEGASMLVEIDLLEILEIDYPEPPQTCESIFENDTTLLPLLEALESNEGGQVHPLLSGAIAVTDNSDFYQQLDADDGGASIEVVDGAVQLQTLIIRDTMPARMSVGSDLIELDGWSLSLLGGATGEDLRGEYVFDAGEALFSLSFSEYGLLRRTAATNVAPFTLVQSSDGQWVLEGLALELEDASGTWSLYTLSGLVFGPPA